MQYSKFAIDEDPFCVWDKNLHQHNVHFLDSIDPDFFEHVVKTHTETLDTKERHAAQALRLFHGHSLETLLAFLFATIQAPDCVFGWLRKYEPSHLRNLIAKVNAGKPILSKLNLRKHQLGVYLGGHPLLSISRRQGEGGSDQEKLCVFLEIFGRSV